MLALRYGGREQENDGERFGEEEGKEGGKGKSVVVGIVFNIPSGTDAGGGVGKNMGYRGGAVASLLARLVMGMHGEGSKRGIVVEDKGVCICGGDDAPGVVGRSEAVVSVWLICMDSGA